MGRPVRWLLDNVTADEWAGWLAFYALEPFGPVHDELRAGVIAAAARGVWGGKARPDDFFPSLKPPRPERRGAAAWLALAPAGAGVKLRETGDGD